MRDTFMRLLIDHAKTNPNIWFMTADLGYSVVEKFEEQFPDRFVNVGVAEQNMLSMAAGIASTGSTVVVYSIINFLILRALEQLRIDICYHNSDVKLIGVGAGYSYGPMGFTHHALDDLAILRVMPYLKIFSPADPIETTFCTKSMLKEPGPCFLRLGKSKDPIFHVKPLNFFGQLLILQEGYDILLISTGSVLKHCLQAASILEKEGLSICIVSCPILKPFDYASFETIASQVKVVVSVEPHAAGGLSSILSEILLQVKNPPRYTSIKYQETPLSICGNEDELNALMGIDAHQISLQALALYHNNNALILS